jgi:hypothetical protein
MSENVNMKTQKIRVYFLFCMNVKPVFIYKVKNTNGECMRTKFEDIFELIRLK